MNRVVIWRSVGLLLCVGGPALGLLLTGADPAHYLEFPPRSRHVLHAGFSWVAFMGLAAVVFVPIAVLVWRVWFDARHIAPRQAVRPFPRWGWAGLGGGAVAWALAWTRLPHAAGLQPYTFIPLWLAYIVVMNALAERRNGHCPMLSRPARYALLFPLSAAFWWYFEYLNRFVQNWFYEGVEGFSAPGYVVCATLSFATVLPAVVATDAWLASYPRLTAGLDCGVALRPRRPRRAAGWSLVLGGVALALVPALPNVLFPLLWLAPVAVLAASEALAGRSTPFDAVECGDWRQVVRCALAALVCGLFWEMWNYWSHARWVYAVPYVGRFPVFEMPILGYVGYLPFGIECALVAGWITGWCEEDGK